MTTYISNAFAISMLPSTDTIVKFVPVSIDNVLAGSDMFVSAVGHADTAALFSAILGRPIPANRISIRLVPDLDVLIVGQYSGPRLPEGSTSLPAGASISWWIVLPATAD